MLLRIFFHQGSYLKIELLTGMKKDLRKGQVAYFSSFNLIKIRRLKQFSDKKYLYLNQTSSLSVIKGRSLRIGSIVLIGKKLLERVYRSVPK